MGGIVAAETVIALTSDQPIHGSTDPAKDDAPDSEKAPPPRPPSPNSLMFPYIQGVLAFDTPYLGISPGVVAHGAEGHYVAATAAISQLSGIAALWGGSKAAEEAAAGNKAQALAAASKDKEADAKAPESSWQRWGRVAMYAGAVSAVAAGGAAAYMNRDQIMDGWGWVSSHLEFVGCLARKEELKRRVAYMVRLNRDLNVGFANLYTRLGQAAGSKKVSMVGTVMGEQRTFCVVPRKDAAGEWKEAVNDAATDETWAHMCKS
jgi:hypothetical protein